MFIPLNQSVISNDEISESTIVSLPSQEPVVKTWHHDCSNTTGFEYMEIPTDRWEYWWTYTETELQSDGQSIPMPTITNTSPVHDYYGPAYVYTLPDVFPLSGLHNFSVHMELNNSDPAYYGVVRVGLLDGQYNPVLTAKIRDWDRLEVRGGCTWMYYIRNWSIHTHTLDNEGASSYGTGYSGGRLEFANMTWSSWFDTSLGVNVSIPAYDLAPALNRRIVPIEEVETARDIKYVVLMFGGYYKYQYQPLPPFRVHDIYLEYELGGVIDTSPPLLIPQLDMVYEVGQTGNIIEWRCSDDYPYRYWVLDYEYSYSFPGTNRQEGLWNGSPYIQSVDDLPVGNRTFLLILQDKAGFIVWDRVTVMVIENPLTIFLRANAALIGITSLLAVVLVLRYLIARRARPWSRNVPMT
ncbi:MAG: hypothetical protein ACTSU3_01920 [Candidatus Thorarchaeota archaeon]